jgi:hypothetical protein
VTDSTAITNGAFQTDGGLGVTKALWVGGLANIAGAVTLQSTLTLTATATPTGAGTGAVGQIAWDTGYLYVCTATNDWRRIALVDF